MALSLFVARAWPAHADTFGTGGNTFTIDFVDVLNAGNANDGGGGGGNFFSPFGGVDYHFRMGVYEISQEQVEKATAGGLSHVTAGAHQAAEPAAGITWYEAAAFVNWLNEQRTPGLRAYNLDGTASSLTLWDAAEAWDNDPGPGIDLNRYRHRDAYYFLPSEDEWYKAAYHQNDGATANYWDFATAGNSAPTQELTGSTLAGSAVYNGAAPGVPADPAEVQMAGGWSAYGTMGQNGNVAEWMESATDGTNNSPAENRAIRGGLWNSPENLLRSSAKQNNAPHDDVGSVGVSGGIGFRVASVPEPSTAGLLAAAGVLCLARRPATTGRGKSK